jgi:hypothetical protein
VVLGVQGDPRCRALFDRALQRWTDPVETFFTLLRQAGIELKRLHDPAAAAEAMKRAGPVLERLRDDGDQGPETATYLQGLRSNFIALLAVRDGSPGRAEELVEESLSYMRKHAPTETRLRQDVVARYEWMTLQNRALLAARTRDWATAVAGYRGLVAFARQRDEKALPSSLAMYGYACIQHEAFEDAIGPLEEARTLAVQHVDPYVARQIEKALARAHLEIGQDDIAAALLDTSRPYWLKGMPA